MTSEQRTALAAFRAVIDPLRLRVKTDPEGWPIVPGRYGQIEWFCDGVDCHSCRFPGQFALAVYTERPRLFGRLWAIPGVRRHQTGDREMRAAFLPAALAAVAGVIQAQRQRIGMTSEEARRRSGLSTVRATSRPQDEPDAFAPYIGAAHTPADGQGGGS